MRLVFCSQVALLACLFALASGPFPQAYAGNAPLRVGMAQSFFHDMTKPLIDSVTEPFVAIVKETAGLSGELVVVGDSIAVAKQLDDNKLQLGVYHGFEFAWVQQKHPELRPLMIAVNSKQALRAYVLVQKDSPAKAFNAQSSIADTLSSASVAAAPRGFSGMSQRVPVSRPLLMSLRRESSTRLSSIRSVWISTRS
jgi:ABC-type phosphate/phosphonate transport system substrate-binding protein